MDKDSESAASCGAANSSSAMAFCRFSNAVVLMSEPGARTTCSPCTADGCAPSAACLGRAASQLTCGAKDSVPQEVEARQHCRIVVEERAHQNDAMQRRLVSAWLARHRAADAHTLLADSLTATMLLANGPLSGSPSDSCSDLTNHARCSSRKAWCRLTPCVCRCSSSRIAALVASSMRPDCRALEGGACA
ncbi:hypothetical protein FA09DRAFT_26628 [Tilletiopsis washingtonensis]|uniref:Uncharacterized protein n=1 Tax=Tilletiopsis washingtonensis TaxID=58919 RepID=A0A316ZBE3_9BASI|nr:hypothetical protein FA09DRAFT_26628 [Tilletiopsis washingtonensis]PWN98348.1 hypothetical protein FA09DRAFT_26628 [Tilletiopsis washingtonensis]